MTAGKKFNRNMKVENTLQEKLIEKKLNLFRHSKHGFGFCIRGGKEHGTGIYISGVNIYSKAYREGLTVGDIIVKGNRKLFHGLSHSEAVQFIRAQKQLQLVVVSRGILPEQRLKYIEYQWIDCYGELCSPLRSSLIEAGKDNLRKVNVVVTGNNKLGLLIRGGSEFGLGIFVAGIDENSIADKCGIMVGEQIIESNGVSFLNISQKDASFLIQNSKIITFLLKDVSKIPVSKIVHNHLQWIDKREKRSLLRAESLKNLQSTVFKPGIVGTQIQHQAVIGPTSYSFLEKKANHSLSQDEWLTLKYYIKEYIHGDITVNGFALSLMDLLDTEAKMSLLNDVRGIVKAHDLETFDTIILGQEVEAIQIENQYSLQTSSNEILSTENTKKDKYEEMNYGIDSYESRYIDHEDEQYDNQEQLERSLSFERYDEGDQVEEIKSLCNEKLNNEKQSKFFQSNERHSPIFFQSNEKHSPIYFQSNKKQYDPESNHLDSTNKFIKESDQHISLEHFKNNSKNQDMNNDNHEININGGFEEYYTNSKKNIKSSDHFSFFQTNFVSNDMFNDKNEKEKEKKIDKNLAENYLRRDQNLCVDEIKCESFNPIEMVKDNYPIKINDIESEKLNDIENILQSYDYADNNIAVSNLELNNQDVQTKSFKMLSKPLSKNEISNPQLSPEINEDYLSPLLSHENYLSPLLSKNSDSFYSYFACEQNDNLNNFQPKYLKNNYLLQEKTISEGDKSLENFTKMTKDPQANKIVFKTSEQYAGTFHSSNSSPTFDVTSTIENRYANFSVNDILRQDYLPDSKVKSGSLEPNESSYNELDNKKTFKLNIRNQYQYENSESYRNHQSDSTLDSIANDQLKMYGKPIMSKSPQFGCSSTVFNASENSNKKLKNTIKSVDNNAVSTFDKNLLKSSKYISTDFDLRAREVPQDLVEDVSGIEEAHKNVIALLPRHKFPTVPKKKNFLFSSNESFVTESIVSKIEAFSNRNTQKPEQAIYTGKIQKQPKTKIVNVPNDTGEPGFAVNSKHNGKYVFISSIENKNLKVLSVGDVIMAIEGKPITVGMKSVHVNLMIKNAFKTSNPNIKLTIKC
ncbi:uncharacterized protein LOC100208667 isoform X3 [Hydra vulgaris]|uniref:Uncharacterized protein LOC100208667 isoform X3 n=2 Tax=Hydra vulgaris TaxID=6087 RepID=A0ABM4BEL1_HYDVU